MSNLAITATLTFSRSKGARRLLQFVIADAVNQHTDVAKTDVRKLAKLCNCSVRYVQHLILKQIAAGELIGVLDPQDGGTWKTFFIPVYKGEDGYDERPCDLDAEGHVCNGTHTPIYISRQRLYDDKGEAARQAERANRRGQVKRPIQTRKGAIARVDKSPSYPHAANDSAHPAANDSAHPTNDSAHPTNDSAHPTNDSAHAYKKTQLYPDITQIDPGPSPASAAHLSLADLRTWAATDEGRSFIAGRGWRGDPAKATAGDVRDWHRAWTRLQYKGAAR